MLLTEYEVLELFLLYYPTNKENIIDQKNIGDGEYMFYIDDGSKVRFDIIKRSMAYIKPRTNLTIDDIDTIWLKEFSRKLKRKLKLRRMTQKDFAQSIGVTYRSVYNYVYGKTVPDYLILRKMSRVLECDIEELTNFDYLL